MIDEKAVAALRDAGRHGTPSEAARVLDGLLPDGIGQDSLTFYFKRAFPGIPLKTLIDAQLWTGVSAGPITDAEFDEMLRPWWPAQD
jgi:hypothetical protein